MKKRIIALTLSFAVLAVVGRAKTNQGEDVSLTTSLQSETAVEHMKIKNPEIKQLLKEALHRMRSADVEVKAFAERKGAQKVKEHFWSVSEEMETNGAAAIIRADFFSETGPLRYGGKCVFKDRTYKEELKDQRYEVYYHENGKVKVFLTIGTPSITLEFYPSGKVKHFCLSGEDHTAIAAFDGGDDDSIKHEVYTGSQK